MGTFEERIGKLVDDRDLPGIVLLAKDNAGKFTMSLNDLLIPNHCYRKRHLLKGLGISVVGAGA